MLIDPLTYAWLYIVVEEDASSYMYIVLEGDPSHPTHTVLVGESLTLHPFSTLLGAEYLKLICRPALSYTSL